ncbi:ribosomal RNA small subunit methyltransferase I [Gemmatimonadetes bacterium T265]|nr:ribosomal RNA small subunit methyltransferase I [Gemmatimonadetes bacterium T265]
MPDAGPTGTLYLVSTPIGNLGDVTVRAAEVLRTADAVLCEDTRHSRRLLDHLGSRAPTLSVHEHNEARRSEALVARLAAGETFALVSDAGTPLVSDPGARLVEAAIAAGIRVVPLPGASAVLAALVASGLDAERFTFFGFLVRRGRERADELAVVAASPFTTVVYEAPGRVPDTLADLVAACGAERRGAVARELTKQYEEIRRGTLGDLAAYHATAAPRGEVVLVVAGRPPVAPADALDDAEVRARARTLLAGGTAPRDAARVLAEAFGLGRNAAYRITQEERGEDRGAEQSAADVVER